MDWITRVLVAYDEAEKKMDFAETTQRKRDLYMFGLWLKDRLGVDIHPEDTRYTLDGYTFVQQYHGIFDTGQAVRPGIVAPAPSMWYSVHLEGQCPECGKTVLSPPIFNDAHLGSLIENFRGDSHACELIEGTGE